MPTPEEISKLKRLVRFGFHDLSSYKEKERPDIKKRIKENIDLFSDRDIEKIAAADELEQYKDKDQWPVTIKIDFPKPKRKYRIVYEIYNQSIEETYFWILNHLKNDMGLNEVIKINDIFSASEQSAVWGNSQARIAAQQDRASNLLRTISEMVKTGLFQLIRELRNLDERLEYYKPGKNNDYTLKGIWIDLVEGGTKNPSSIYGLSQNVNFVTLPDLFFRTYIKSLEPSKYKTEIEEKIEHLRGQGFNEKVFEVLTRKLNQYSIWRDKTKKELEQRKRFTVKHLRQHYNSIKMYMSWVKPYLKNLSRLNMDEKRQSSADLISAFDGSMLEIELMTRRRVGTFNEWYKEIENENGRPVTKSKSRKKDMYAVVITNMVHRTAPLMSYSTEQGRGPIHVGRVEIEHRSYTWSEDECKNYLDMKNDEIFDMIGEFDATLKDIFNQFEEELKKYLTDLGENFENKEEEKKDEKPVSQDTAFSLVKNIFLGFGDLFGPLIPTLSAKKPKKSGTSKDSLIKGAEKVCDIAMWNVYKNYKKSHGMLSW